MEVLIRLLPVIVIGSATAWYYLKVYRPSQSNRTLKPTVSQAYSTEKKCGSCAMMIPKEAAKCPYCRSKVGITSMGKVIAGLFILMMAAMIVRCSETPTTTAVTAVAAPQVAKQDKTKKISGLVVRGKSIAVGDRFDDVTSVLLPADCVYQDQTSDKLIPGSLFLQKTYDVSGKKFTLYVARKEATGPYFISNIEVPDS